MLPDLRPANSRIYSTSHFGLISNQGVDTKITGDVCPFNVLPHQGRKWQIALQIFYEMDSWQVSSMTGNGTCNTRIHDVFVFASGIYAFVESIVYLFM